MTKPSTVSMAEPETRINSETRMTKTILDAASVLRFGFLVSDLILVSGFVIRISPRAFPH
jgi:hypothetical protein